MAPSKWWALSGDERRDEALDRLLKEAAPSFAPIPLDLLNQRAGLTTRSERKYVLDTEIFGRLVGELVPHYLILEVDGLRVFPYDTVYFDTPERVAYRDHLQGRRKRFKCRTRLYVASELCFFELKLKGGRGQTIKRRLDIPVAEHGSLSSVALAYLDRELQEAYGRPAPVPLGPMLRTYYRRLTLVGRTSAERLTFDFELTYTSDGQEFSIRPGRILLEIKNDSAAGEASKGNGEAHRVLQRLGVRPVESCTKYCIGVALAHPELRNNRFRRLIRNHFEAPHLARPVVAAAVNGKPLAPAETVRRAIAAYKGGDVESVRRYVHEDAEAYTFLVLRAETPFNGGNGTSKSAGAPRSRDISWLGNKAISEQIELGTLDLVEADGRVMGFGQMTLSANGNGRSRTVEAAWVWETREGKISYMASYLDPNDALRAKALQR